MRYRGKASQVMMLQSGPVDDLTLIAERGQALEITAISRDGVRGQSTFQRQVIEKLSDLLPLVGVHGLWRLVALAAGLAPERAADEVAEPTQKVDALARMEVLRVATADREKTDIY